MGSEVQGNNRNGALPAFEARELTVGWDDGKPVVENVRIVVPESEIACLVGKSGMGKTTILHALAGLVEPLKGHVMLHGEDVTGQAGRVSYMLQKDLLLPNLSVMDNACLPLLLAGEPKPQAREKARELLGRFGLADVCGKWPSQLSGGMRQRVAFARTCLMGNDVILLDEPFSALDAVTRADVRTWFAAEARSMGLSTLMITHDADEACTVADRIYVLGRLETEQGTPSPARIVGEVIPDRPADAGFDAYALTPEFLAAKSRVLSLLQ